MSRTVIHEALEAVEAGTPAALATVVTTRGSTPQKVGAKLLVRADGRCAGTLGGGAVEAEAIREARAALAGGAALRGYALATATDEWGLACGGTMVVFIEPLTTGARPWLAAAAAALEGGAPAAVTTLIDGPGAGAKLLVRAGRAEGSLGEPALDRAGLEIAGRVLEHEGAEVASVGAAMLYGECFAPRPTLFVVGAGHVGKALAGLGRFCGFRVVVIDDRPEYANRERFPEAGEVLARPLGEALRAYPVSRASAIVVAARNQDLDYEATRAALATPARYVGLIGSRRKAILVTERLIAEGFPPERVRELRSPIGLDLGARTPEEIAVSIVGEILMLRRGAGGRPMQLSDQPRDKAVPGAERRESPAGRRTPGP